MSPLLPGGGEASFPGVCVSLGGTSWLGQTSVNKLTPYLGYFQIAESQKVPYV